MKERLILQKSPETEAGRFLATRYQMTVMEATRVNESSGCEALSQNKSTSDEIVEDFQIKKSLIVKRRGNSSGLERLKT